MDKVEIQLRYLLESILWKLERKVGLDANNVQWATIDRNDAVIRQARKYIYEEE